MSRRLIAPPAYRQGPDALSEPDAFDPLSGERAFVLGGDTAIGVAGERIEDGLDRAGIEVAGVELGVDACTFEGIDRLAGAARGADVVVGAGGGVALDASKGVADALGAELATVPTVASTDAPCSSVAVVYDDGGAFDGYVRRDRNPELVIVDTRVVAEAPARFLRHGLGDALATRFEAEAADRAAATTHAGGRATDAALALARRCYRSIDEHGEAALAAVGRDAVTPAVERAVEAAVLLSGVGFESGGLAAAHAFGKGFSRAGGDAPHGLRIAFGTVAQLVLEGRDPALVEEVIALSRELGIARTLEDLGDPDVDAVAEAACRDDTTMDNEPFAVTPRDAADALRAADALLGA